MEKKNRFLFSLVMPCYNEKKSLSSLVKRFSSALSGRMDVELVLVDNGSSDGTPGEIARLQKRYKFVSTAKVQKNIGYGYGILTGLRKAKGEFLGWTHADLQTDPADALRALELVQREKEPKMCFAKGRRKKRAFVDSFFTFGMSVFETALMGTVLYDINAQPNVFHRSFLSGLKRIPNDFSFDLYFYYTAKKRGLKIIRFPVDFSRRIHGKSHWNTGLASKWKFIKRTVAFSLKLKGDLSRNAENNP